MLKGSVILTTCVASLVAMFGCVKASESYAQEHPMDGLQLKMTYCIEMPSTIGDFRDIGCKVGHGIGKRGVQTDIIKKIVERLNKNQESPAYKMLVSNDGVPMTFVDETLGSKTKARVWQDGNGRLYYVFERE